MYQLIENGVRRLSDNAYITNKNSRAWRTYEAWLADGNVPLPIAVPQALVVDVNEEKIKAKMRETAIADLGDELPAGYK